MHVRHCSPAASSHPKKLNHHPTTTPPPQTGDMVIEYVGALVRPSVADALERRHYDGLVGAGGRPRAPGARWFSAQAARGRREGRGCAAALRQGGAAFRRIQRTERSCTPVASTPTPPSRFSESAPQPPGLLLLPPPPQKKGTYIFRLNEDMCVDATVAGNIAHLLNHSCAPCCHSRTITVTHPVTGERRDHVVIFASRWGRVGWWGFGPRRGRTAATCRLAVWGRPWEEFCRTGFSGGGRSAF
jgi:hypothetical protein